MGFYDGAGIHGTDAINSLGTAASHGCVRMAIKDVMDLFDRVQRRHARSTLLTARSERLRRRRQLALAQLLDRDLLPAALEQQGMVVGVAKNQRADEDALLPLSQHRMPQGRRVAGALDPVPRTRRIAARVGDPGLDELALPWRPDPWTCR